MNPPIGVILAAGRGQRMMPFSQIWPKPLLPVGNRPVLFHQIQHMKNLGISKIFIVVSHLSDEIRQVIEQKSIAEWSELVDDIEIKFIEQGETQGIAHAVGCLEASIQEPFLLFLGDIVFQHRGFDKMIEKMGGNEPGAVLAIKREADEEALRRNFCVIQDENGLVTRVIEKPRYPPTQLKGCGIYYFHPVVFDAVRRTPKTHLRGEYELTDTIQILIDDGYPVYGVDIIEEDLNLTSPRDILLANQNYLRLIEKSVLIDCDARIDPKASYHEVCVGPRAEVVGEVHLERVVVFPDAVVDRDLHDALVTREQIVFISENKP